MALTVSTTATHSSIVQHGCETFSASNRELPYFCVMFEDSMSHLRANFVLTCEILCWTTSWYLLTSRSSPGWQRWCDCLVLGWTSEILHVDWDTAASVIGFTNVLAKYSCVFVVSVARRGPPTYYCSFAVDHHTSCTESCHLLVS